MDKIDNLKMCIVIIIILIFIHGMHLFSQGYIENNPVSVTVYNNAAGVFPLRNLHEPIIVALPPRHLNKVIFDHHIKQRTVLNILESGQNYFLTPLDL